MKFKILFLFGLLLIPLTTWSEEVCNIPQGCPIDENGICEHCVEDSLYTNGYFFYDRYGTIPILKFNKEKLSCVDTVIITAYLHEKVIAQKLHNEGFSGRILSISPTPPSSEIENIEWLF